MAQQILKGKTIVLDLDLTIVHTTLDCECGNHVELEHAAMIPGHVGPEITIPPKSAKSCVHVRPHAFEFISRCYDAGCQFVIFSANGLFYIRQVVDILFKDVEGPIEILTDRELVHDPNSDYYVKMLSTVVNRTGIPVEQLVAIDDNIYMYPNDENVIRISPWYNNVLLEDDCELKKLYLGL